MCVTALAATRVLYWESMRSHTAAGWRAAASAARTALAALGLLVVLVTVTPLVPWYAIKLAGPWPESRGGTLIVLAGSIVGGSGDAYVGHDTFWRCVGAVRAFREGKFRRIVVSGAGVAPLMRDFLVASGVPADAIQTETQSRSTRENALYAARLLAAAPGSKVLLTSDYHMFRASRAFARAGLPVGEWPVPDALKGNWIRRWPAFLDETEETAKIAYYFWRGWI